MGSGRRSRTAVPLSSRRLRAPAGRQHRPRSPSVKSQLFSVNRRDRPRRPGSSFGGTGSCRGGTMVTQVGAACRGTWRPHQNHQWASLGVAPSRYREALLQALFRASDPQGRASRLTIRSPIRWQGWLRALVIPGECTGGFRAGREQPGGLSLVLAGTCILALTIRGSRCGRPDSAEATPREQAAPRGGWM